MTLGEASRGNAKHSQLSFVLAGRRSSIPETVVMDTTGRGVLDTLASAGYDHLLCGNASPPRDPHPGLVRVRRVVQQADSALQNRRDAQARLRAAAGQSSRSAPTPTVWKLSIGLKSKYPDDMTIILQNDFEQLNIKDDRFEVLLRLMGNRERLSVPFNAIKAFWDKIRSEVLRRLMPSPGVARRISAQSPVMRAIGCSTNSRQDASSGIQRIRRRDGFSCRARTAPWACPSARVESVSAFEPSLPLQRRQHGAHQRQICRPVRQMPVHARDQLRLGVLAERVQFRDQAPPPPGPGHPSAATLEFWRRTASARRRQASRHRPAAGRSARAAPTDTTSASALVC